MYYIHLTEIWRERHLRCCAKRRNGATSGSCAGRAAEVLPRQEPITRLLWGE